MLKKGKQSAWSACFHPGFHKLDLGRVPRHSFQIRRGEKYTEEMVDAINLAFTKSTFSYIMKIKSHLTLKRGVLLDLKISDFGWKRGLFLVLNPRKGVVFQAWERVWYTFCSGGSGDHINHKNTPYLAFAGELWGIVSWVGNWPRYNDIAL